MLLIDLENAKRIKQSTNCRQQFDNINEGFFAVLFLEELHDLGYLVFLHLYLGDGGFIYTNDLVV